VSKTFADYDIDTRGRTGNVKTTCPQCSQTRKNTKDPCLSVNTDEGLWKCHHCGWSGGLNGAGDLGFSRSKKTYRRPIYQPTDQYDDTLVAWFQARGIHQEVVKRNKISLGRKFIPGLEKRSGVHSNPVLPQW